MKSATIRNGQKLSLFAGDLGFAIGAARKGALVAFPDAVTLVKLSTDEELAALYEEFDMLLPQSGRMALLQRMVWRKHAPRVTLESFLPGFLDVIERNQLGSVHWLFQNEEQAKRLCAGLAAKGIKVNEDEYHLLENDDGQEIEAYELKFLFRAITPRVVILSLPPRVEEKTALFLRKELGERTTIICGGRPLRAFCGIKGEEEKPDKETTRQLLEIMKAGNVTLARKR